MNFKDRPLWQKIGFGVVTIGVTGTIIYLSIDKYRSWAKSELEKKKILQPLYEALAEKIVVNAPTGETWVINKGFVVENLTSINASTEDVKNFNEMVSKPSAEWNEGQKKLTEKFSKLLSIAQKFTSQ